ncbi:MAG: type II toxin-antitoxin system VapB family antitoxin, partial [Treponema sp.]|nr:type II toxin-antitoxin system VapB family antitoxin [Treponema sp.]
MSKTTTTTVGKPLLAQAVAIGRQGTEDETVNLALKEFIQNHNAEEIINAFGTIEYDSDYDYKQVRN